MKTHTKYKRTELKVWADYFLKPNSECRKIRIPERHFEITKTIDEDPVDYPFKLPKLQVHEIIPWLRNTEWLWPESDKVVIRASAVVFQDDTPIYNGQSGVLIIKEPLNRSKLYTLEMRTHSKDARQLVMGFHEIGIIKWT